MDFTTRDADDETKSLPTGRTICESRPRPLVKGYGRLLISGGVQSASVAFGPAGEILEVNSVTGVLRQYNATGGRVLSGVQSASVAFAPDSEVLDIIFSDGSLDQDDATVIAYVCMESRAALIAGPDSGS